MSKASERTARLAELSDERLQTFKSVPDHTAITRYGKNVRFTLTEDGFLQTVTDGHIDIFSCNQEHALALGKWLIEMFGE